MQRSTFYIQPALRTTIIICSEMCGPQTFRPSQPLGGALVVLGAPRFSPTTRLLTPPPEEDDDDNGEDIKTVDAMPPSLSGHLIFHSQPSSSSCPTSHATHATFLAANGGDIDYLAHCVVGVHQTGDLRSDDQGPLLHSFDFRRPPVGSRSVEVRLSRPLEIGVGGAGIIGRRVSVWLGGQGGRQVAEGIVGFN